MKNGIQIGAGVIDPDYTGEISVIIFNMGDNDFEVKKGDRVAQLILERCETPPVEEISLLEETEEVMVALVLRELEQYQKSSGTGIKSTPSCVAIQSLDLCTLENDISNQRSQKSEKGSYPNLP